ncbi:hypothetical protein BDZ94DRAFT_1285309 [Collybia nuda]|uniref:Elongator complex protein 5 n=1 Tax=Collybia nuda TaxID=64659 RepID=A0A9P5XUX2_9AGAR|nr:hypothetical protein BDZ94DRAFT_1285959 [Collybia nuda]KAF9457359.1 hypothetical protein BDZ94DRAFT_1285309 [Collybia nuda]
MLSPFNLPDGILVLITDELSSPADFLLYRSFITHVKESKDSRTIILSVSEEIARWKAIAAKSNVNVSQLLDSKSLTFVDVLSHVQPRSDNSAPSSLRPIFDLVSTNIETTTAPLLVILDDIATLEWIGFELLDITRFCRALRGMCLKANATLVIRHHLVTPDVPDDLFLHLLQICTYHLDVRPLSSGRSGSVSGAVALHVGPSTPLDADGVKLIPRSSAIQYRLTDTGPVFFDRGTAEGVL